MVEIAQSVTEELKEQFEHCEPSTKMSAEEEDSAKLDIEEGELPEDGEIMEEEDENKHKETPAAQRTGSSSAHRKPAPLATHMTKSSTPHSKPPPKYKDFDAKTTKPSVSQDAMLSSWVTGVQKKSNRPSSPSADVDPNEEYYGVASTGGDANPGQGDTDFRSLEAGGEHGPSGGDKDFREHVGGMAELNEYGDADFRKPPNVSPPRFERRRRRSSSPEDRFKRGRFESPIRRRGPIRTRWTERTICKFFREGYCRDGDHCAYSHNAADSHRRPEVCKFYQHGYCKKGLACPHLHGEYPCKAFHKGECSKNPCQFSHQPLNDYTRPIFDQMMRDEELASRISVPQVPMRRKVLLPQGPDSNPPNDMPMIDPATGQIPPPGVVVPVISSAHSMAPPDRVANTNGSANFGFFNPVTPSTMAQQPMPQAAPARSPAQASAGLQTAASSTPPSQPAAPVDSAPSIAQLMAGILHPSSSPVKTEPSSSAVEPVTSGAFNIDQMLQSITQQVAPKDEIDESPASPPMFGASAEPADAPVIPVSRPWKLIPVHVESTPDIAFDLKLVQQISAGMYKNDPRVKRLAEKQFDLVTKTLEQQSAKALLASATPPSTSTETAAAKPVDPRTSGRDPRLRTAQPAPAVPSPSQQPPATGGATSEEAFRSMVEQQIQMANQLAAQQAREQPPFDAHVAPMPQAAGGFPPANQYDPRMGPAPSHPPGEPYFGQGPPQHHQFPSPNHDPYYDGRGGTDNRPPPRFRGRGRGRGFFRGRGRPHFEHGNGPEHPNYGNHSPSNWNFEHNRGGDRLAGGGEHDSFSNAQANPSGHVSLREKRKHNEYESPLA